MTQKQNEKPIVLIPSRLASTRLPNKPLADIHGLPMIVHVLRRAQEADLGPVVVACGDQEIVDVVRAAGGEALLTDPCLPSGSDRIHAALSLYDPDETYGKVINVQGDLPTVEPATIRAVAALLDDPAVDLSTAIAPITSEDDRTNPAVVKAVVELADGQRAGRALYFSRNLLPANDGVHYHHIGLYGYRRAALKRFVSLPPAVLEQREKLEQLRALSNGMSLFATVVDEVPFGVDTPEQLETARKMLAARQ